MIPRTFLSTYASNGQQQMAVVFLTDITGLKRWADYIPVKLAQGGSENSYANNGYVDVVSVVKTSTMRPFAEYVPVYVDDSASDAWQVNATGYIPYGFAGFGDASMVLDFTNGAALDSRVTFTRASTATYFNSSGVLTTTGFNLLTYSEELDTGWANGTAATWQVSSGVSPAGTTTALGVDGLSGTAVLATSSSLYKTAITISGSTAYTFSVYVRTKTGTATNVRLRLSETGGNNTISSDFTVTTAWTRISLSVTTAAGATQVATVVGTGTGTANLYIWGAQLETGSIATTYIPTVASTSGAARFDYNPTTLAPLGLLIEESRTNLFTYSEQFDNVAWTKTRATVTANAIVSPDGTADADKLVEDTTATNSHLFSATITSTTGVNTFSIFAKAAERPRLQLRFAGGSDVRGAAFNLLTGTVEAETLSATTQANNPRITNVGNGWYRCSIDSSGTGDTTVQGYLDNGTSHSYTGNGTSGLYIWGAQLEAGAFATSYIPTVASQVTRAADLALMTGTNFSSWYNATEGTWFADFTPPTSDYLSNKNIFLASNNNTNNFNGLRYISSGSVPGFGVTASNTVQAGLQTGTMVANTTYKMAGAYKLNDFAVSRNGASVVTDTSGTIPTVTQAEIGTLASLNIGTQHIRRLAYYNRRLTNAELQGITA